MEIAVLPVQKEKISLWKSLNRGAMQRPMVVIDQHPWNELNITGALTCQVQDPYWRGVEGQLRKTIYAWDHFPVDMVVDPFIAIPPSMTNSGGLSHRKKAQGSFLSPAPAPSWAISQTSRQHGTVVIFRLFIDSFAFAAHALPRSSGRFEARFSFLSQCHW